jgi:hypothetical protein
VEARLINDEPPEIASGGSRRTDHFAEWSGIDYVEMLPPKFDIFKG